MPRFASTVPLGTASAARGATAMTVVDAIATVVVVTVTAVAVTVATSRALPSRLATRPYRW